MAWKHLSEGPLHSGVARCCGDDKARQSCKGVYLAIDGRTGECVLFRSGRLSEDRGTVEAYEIPNISLASHYFRYQVKFQRMVGRTLLNDLAVEIPFFLTHRRRQGNPGLSRTEGQVARSARYVIVTSKLLLICLDYLLPLLDKQMPTWETEYPWVLHSAQH